MLARPPLTFEGHSGRSVGHHGEVFILDTTDRQAEHDVRRRSRTRDFPEWKIAADVINGLHTLGKKHAEGGGAHFVVLVTFAFLARHHELGAWSSCIVG